MDYRIQAIAMLDATNNDVTQAFKLAQFNARRAPLGCDSAFEYWVAVAEILIPQPDPQLWN